MLHTSVLFIFMASLTSYISATTNNAPHNVHQLFARQSIIDPDEIPPACADSCAETVSTLNDCAEFPRPACGCSLTDEASNVDCFNCFLFGAEVVFSPATIQSTQATIDGYVEGCNAAGVSLPFTTLGHFPTQQTVSIDPGRTSASATQTFALVTQTSASLTALFSPLSSPTPSPSSVLNSENKNSVSAVGAVAVAVALLGLLY